MHGEPVLAAGANEGTDCVEWRSAQTGGTVDPQFMRRVRAVLAQP